MTDQTNSATENQPPLLNTTDLKNLLLIIDLASKRGAFQPKEFAAIAEIYNRVDEFILKASPPSANPSADPTVGA